MSGWLQKRFPSVHLWLFHPRLSWQIHQHGRRWRRACLYILQNGDVRDIQRVGDAMIELGEALKAPVLIDEGGQVREAAEELVLRRKWSWRINR